MSNRLPPEDLPEDELEQTPGGIYLPPEDFKDHDTVEREIIDASGADEETRLEQGQKLMQRVARTIGCSRLFILVTVCESCPEVHVSAGASKVERDMKKWMVEVLEKAKKQTEEEPLPRLGPQAPEDEG